MQAGSVVAALILEDHGTTAEGDAADCAASGVGWERRGRGANRGEGQSAAAASGLTSLEPYTSIESGGCRYVTVAPDTWARSVRYMVNTCLYHLYRWVSLVLKRWDCRNISVRRKDKQAPIRFQNIHKVVSSISCRTLKLFIP